MNKPSRSSHPLIKIINNSLIDLPTPSNISTYCMMLITSTLPFS